jgi:hypothetical protein
MGLRPVKASIGQYWRTREASLATDTFYVNIKLNYKLCDFDAALENAAQKVDMRRAEGYTACQLEKTLTERSKLTFDLQRVAGWCEATARRAESPPESPAKTGHALAKQAGCARYRAEEASDPEQTAPPGAKSGGTARDRLAL